MIINGQYRYGIDSLTTLEYADPDALAKRYHDLKKNDVW